MITDRQRTFLKHAGYRELLTLWRFEPNGSEWFCNDPLHTLFMNALDRERNLLTLQQMSDISHQIGFKGGVSRGAFDQISEFRK